MHIFVEIFDNLFLGTSFNIDMSIILHTQIMVAENNPAIVQLLSIDDNYSTIMSSLIFNKLILFNARFIAE